MTKTLTAEKPRNVRAEIDDATHKALRSRQNRIEEGGSPRPQITEVVSMALREWAGQQNAAS